jgi:hypothetical protein
LHDFEQLPPVFGRVHGDENFRQAVNGVHIAVCGFPHHVSERQGNGSGHKVDFIFADLAGWEYNTLVDQRVCHNVLLEF